MDPLQIVTIFCLCDDLVKALAKPHHLEKKNSDAEVMLICIVAALWFGGNLRRSALFLFTHRYLSSLISEGCLNRRIHRFPENYWLGFNAVCTKAKAEHYVVDSFPIPACIGIRSQRCSLFQGKQYRGYNASKNQFFHGIKCHVIISHRGQVMTFLITPGSVHDMTAFRFFNLKGLRKKTIYGDAGYTCYAWEDRLKKQGFRLMTARRYDAKRQHSPQIEAEISRNRKKIETAFSQILSRFPRKIQASTPEGFELKVIFFLIAHSFSLSNFS
jgi:Transposase DDE domain